ncbi:CBS domain-containing protein [Candidatus Nomurabacteria bacterium]|nr:CBS domain-containing protein [Candidatus Nomurabacteria bacterium]
MRTLLWVILVTDYLFLLMIGSVRLKQYEMSDFSLRQMLIDKPGSNNRQINGLHNLLPKVALLQRVELVVAGTLSVALATYLLGPLIALLFSLLIFTLIVLVSRIKFVQNLAVRLFESTLDIVLSTVHWLGPLWVILGVPPRSKSFQPSSTIELVDQISKLPASVVDSNQKQRLISVIESETKVVKDIMTSIRKVVVVKPSAILGPIVLSDLQKTGHGFFPVVDKDAEPEGILDISDISDIQSAKQQGRVRDIMSSQMVWVEEDTSLAELIQAFLQEKQYLMLVRNLNGDFTGIVTIADLMKQLIGVVKD